MHLSLFVKKSRRSFWIGISLSVCDYEAEESLALRLTVFFFSSFYRTPDNISRRIQTLYIETIESTVLVVLYFWEKNHHSLFIFFSVAPLWLKWRQNLQLLLVVHINQEVLYPFECKFEQDHSWLETDLHKKYRWRQTIVLRLEWSFRVQNETPPSISPGVHHDVPGDSRFNHNNVRGERK